MNILNLIRTILSVIASCVTMSQCDFDDQRPTVLPNRHDGIQHQEASIIHNNIKFHDPVDELCNVYQNFRQVYNNSFIPP